MLAKVYEWAAIDILDRIGYRDYYPDSSKFKAWCRDYYHVRLRLGHEFSDHFLTFYLYDQRTSEVCILIKSVAINDSDLFDHINLVYGIAVVLFGHLYADDENPLREGDLRRLHAEIENELAARQGEEK